MTTDELMREISFGSYLSAGAELDRITSTCQKVLEEQNSASLSKAKQIEAALQFTEAIWEKYDCVEIAKIFAKFQRVEEALFGLERDPDARTRYREHFVHMFNCYVFGLRIITALRQQVGDEDMQKIFRIRNENLKAVGLPFGEDYPHYKRLFYLWTLIATFHDLAIPFQHLEKIGTGINKFVEEFGWEFTNPRASIKPYDASTLYTYFDLLGGMYGGGVTPTSDGNKYVSKPHPYIAEVLGSHFDSGDHGVLSGFFMWNIIQEIFVLGRSKKYTFTMDEFNAYHEYVLRQDIARAALAISFHNLKEDKKSGRIPQMFPVEFSKLPLTFLLMLCDELQEYLRWEGSTVSNQVRFKSHPRLKVTTENPAGNILVTACVTFSWRSEDKDDVISQAKGILRHLRQDENRVTDLDTAADVVGNSIKDSLLRKIQFTKAFKLRLEIKENWDRCLFMKDLESR